MELFFSLPPLPLAVALGRQAVWLGGRQAGEAESQLRQGIFPRMRTSNRKIVLLLPHSLYLSLYQTTKTEKSWTTRIPQRQTFTEDFLEMEIPRFFSYCLPFRGFLKRPLQYCYPLLLHYILVITSHNANVHCAISMVEKREKKTVTCNLASEMK